MRRHQAAAASGSVASLVSTCLLAILPARAQDPLPLPEGIQIGLSTDRIAITADFSGANLTIFGAIENPDLLVSRQGRYDVIVALEGPAQPVVVRCKERILGMWINTRSETFINVPVSYSMSTTRPLQDITDLDSYHQLSLGPANIYLEPQEKRGNPLTVQEFTDALRDRKEALGLYFDNIGGVQFRSHNLFSATLPLAPNIPVGTHKARALLFRNGLFIKETSTQLAIVRSGFEQTIFRFASDHGFGYGLFAIGLAMLAGWFGRIIFRKD